MFLIGAAFVLEAAVTVAWQEPFSAVYTARQQERLADELGRRERRLEAVAVGQASRPKPREASCGGCDKRIRHHGRHAGFTRGYGRPLRQRAEASALRRSPAGPVAVAAALAVRNRPGAAALNAALEDRRRERAKRRAAIRGVKREAGIGSALGRLVIAKLDLKAVIVQGTDPGVLRSGPGHYIDSALPGERGSVGIAGHRTTYSAPFRNLNKLRKGDSVTVDMPYGEFTYSVEGSRIVAPSETSVLKTVRHNRLVLTACHPLFSDAQRIVIFARLVEIRPI